MREETWSRRGVYIVETPREDHEHRIVECFVSNINPLNV